MGNARSIELPARLPMPKVKASRFKGALQFEQRNSFVTMNTKGAKMLRDWLCEEFGVPMTCEICGAIGADICAACMEFGEDSEDGNE